MNFLGYLSNYVWLIASIILFSLGALFQRLYEVPFTFDAIFFSRAYKYYMFGSASISIYIIDLITKYINHRK